MIDNQSHLGVPDAKNCFTVAIPSKLSSHVSQLLMQKVPLSNGDRELSMSDWCYSCCLHALGNPQALLCLVLALLNEFRIIVLDSNPFVLSDSILFCLNLVSPLIWSGVALTSVPNSMLEFLAAPVPLIVALGLPINTTENSVTDPVTLLKTTLKDDVRVRNSFSHMEFNDDFIKEIINEKNPLVSTTNIPSHTIVWIPSQSRIFFPKEMSKMKLLLLEKLYYEIF